MKPETSNALTAADQAIAHALGILSINIPVQAARLAYYGQFHAAQAYIFERAGKVVKTHKGVRKEFHRLALSDPLLPPSLASQLSSDFRFKEIADYETAKSVTITSQIAQDAIATAERFVATIRSALA
jgi:uncharacterized protein (UPF0332 family)